MTDEELAGELDRLKAVCGGLAAFLRGVSGWVYDMGPSSGLGWGGVTTLCSALDEAADLLGEGKAS